SVTDGQLNINSVYGSVDDPEVTAIEVIPAAAPPAPPGPPTVTAKSPPDASTGVSTGTTVAATFSRGMDATTITSSSFTLKAPNGSTVPATVTYNSAANTATLTPTAALANSTT